MTATSSTRPPVSVGFALTQHCNLRCPHCIRDDVTSVVELDINVILRVLTEARELLGNIEASFTGGEPMLHREWPRLVDGLRDLGIPYVFVSNGWHIRRFTPLIDRYAPAAVRLSLSGATEEVHDEERGRDSFRRVLLATAILTSRQVPVSYSLIVDRRTRHQMREAVALGNAMGVAAVRFILPQPVPASAARDSDLSPEEWWEARREMDNAARFATTTRVFADYGAPFLGEEMECDSMALRRIYIDVHGRISTCCQLSEFGGNETDVVADIVSQPFAVAYKEYVRRIDELRLASLPQGPDDRLAAFPCLRCARASGKMAWLQNFPESPWSFAGGDSVATLVPLSYSRRARRVTHQVA